ncbi:MAG: chemotaxis protein CheD [Anaerolineae bacterium]|nr:chemotaxis protein CheD [Anaerolineae bacterium]MDW8099706.1 chemotaxis protein CheD [Anaerolineae bacterium]
MAYRSIVKEKVAGGSYEESRAVAVGLGEMVVSRRSDCVLVAYGLGSCIGLAAYDPVESIGGLLHAVLPRHRDNDVNPAKFVDTGIPALIAEMERQGAKASRLRWYAAGGAQMLTTSSFQGMFNIGQQNLETMQRVLAQYGFVLSGASLGGHVGRTLKLYLPDGRVTVRFAGQEEEELSRT